MLVRTPGFFKAQMTNDVFVRHYTAVADASPVPVLLYNFTAVTGVNLLPAAVARLATHPNIVGMKESGGDVAQIADLVSPTPADFTRARRLGGDVLPALCVGAAGGILALGGVAAGAVRAPVRADEGRPPRRGASRCSGELVPLARLLGAAYGVPGLKAALNLLGYDVGLPRPPLLPLDACGGSALKAALAPFDEVGA